jgi:hypothetical protein
VKIIILFVTPYNTKDKIMMPKLMKRKDMGIFVAKLRQKKKEKEIKFYYSLNYKRL